MTSATLVRLLPGGDPATGMQPSTMTDPAAFLVPDPHETSHVFFRNARGTVTAGVWECSPCREEIGRYGVDELCVILAGSVTITETGGAPQVFGPGDSFAIGESFSGTWHITETLRKFWMIVEPPAGG